MKLIKLKEHIKWKEGKDMHFDISRTIIDDIIPYHLEFFLGVRKEELDGDVNFDDEDIK